MGFLQDSDQLISHLASLCDWDQFLENILDKLHVVLPHSLQFGLLESLMSLGLWVIKQGLTNHLMAEFHSLWETLGFITRYFTNVFAHLV